MILWHRNHRHYSTDQDSSFCLLTVVNLMANILRVDNQLTGGGAWMCNCMCRSQGASRSCFGRWESECHCKSRVSSRAAVFRLWLPSSQCHLVEGRENASDDVCRAGAAKRLVFGSLRGNSHISWPLHLSSVQRQGQCCVVDCHSEGRRTCLQWP